MIIALLCGLFPMLHCIVLYSLYFPQLSVLLAAIYNLWSVSSSIHRKEGLHGVNQALSWLILGMIIGNIKIY